MAVAACGGLALAGSAAATPSIMAGAKVATVTFTANVINGGTTYAIDSTSCTLRTAAGRSSSCFLSGAGDLTAGGAVKDANIAITGKKGPITLSLTGINNCGTGSGVDVTTTGPIPVVATTQPWGKGPTVMGTIQIYQTGNRTIFCDN